MIVTLNPTTQFQKANDARRKSDLAQIQRALEVYYNDHGSYPGSVNNKINDPQNGGQINWGSSWGNFMDIVPKDPGSGANYAYFQTQNGQGYRLYATLDWTKDPTSCNGGSACPHAPGGACGKACLYAVTSPNESP